MSEQPTKLELPVKSDVDVVKGRPEPVPYSLNSRLIVETYKADRTLKSVERNGFAMISQKVSVVGLKVLVTTKLSDGTYIHSGDKAYIREEYLHTSPWAKKVFESDAISEPFIIVDINNVEFIQPK